MTDKTPFAIQAAKASWVAPLITIVLGVAARSATANSSEISPGTMRTIWLVTGGLSLLIVVAGLVLGILALFGIKKHGIKGILFPSIVGILLSLGWLYLLASAVQVARQAAERAQVQAK
jgi:hypothetical protein